MALSGAVQGDRARMLPQPGIHAAFQSGRLAVVCAQAVDEQHAALAIAPGAFNESGYCLTGFPHAHAMQVEFAPNLDLPVFQALENALLNTCGFPGQDCISPDFIHDNRGRPTVTVIPVRQAFRGVAPCLRVRFRHVPASLSDPVAQQWLHVGYRFAETGVGAGLGLLG